MSRHPSSLPAVPVNHLAVEQEWLRLIREGNREAFDAMYVALVRPLYAFAQRFVSADVAEDVVQDIMLDLWDRRETLVLRGSLRGYLFGAVRRRIADRRRHEGVVRDVTAAMVRGTLPPPPSALPPMTPADDAEASELEQSVATALASLPGRSRLILTLRWQERLSYPEIAEALGISVAAAKKQGRRMELVIRQLLARFSPD